MTNEGICRIWYCQGIDKWGYWYEIKINKTITVSSIALYMIWYMNRSEL